MEWVVVQDNYVFSIRIDVGTIGRIFLIHGNYMGFLMKVSGTLLITIALYKICVSNGVTNFFGNI